MKLMVLNFRNLSLFLLVFLAACDDPKSPDATLPNANENVSSSTFAEPVAAAATTQPANAQSPTPASVWPADNAVVDPNHYYMGQDSYSLYSVAYTKGPNGGDGDTDRDIMRAGLLLSEVDETPSSKHHQMIVNNQTIDYTARAGHLIAHAPRDPANPGAARDAEASVFYMSYMRDDIPADQRPVTFFFNGGPEEPSIWLHLGSWAPKHLEVNEPHVVDGPNMPDSFPLVDNPQTLLDQTDMVFVDLVGSGLSEAIKPHRNIDFWNTDSDAQIFRDFITAYINHYKRQSSPKYLYGESYSGIRTPIVADLLVKAGTSEYDPDPSGKPPVVLTGFVLQSPVLDYAGLYGGGNLFPTYAMTADYYGVGKARGAKSETEYADYLRSFTTQQYTPATTDATVVPSDDFEATLKSIIGFSPSDVDTTLASFNYNLDHLFEILYPHSKSFEISVDGYDLRNSTDKNINYDISFYEDAGFYGAIKPHLLDEFNYRSSDPTQLYGADFANPYWTHNHNGDLADTSVPDLVEALTLAPDLRVLVVHGYHDRVTAFFQSEVDLRKGGALPQLADRLSVKDYDGGHMTYLTPASHVSMSADLHEFYSAPKASASSATPSVAAR